MIVISNLYAPNPLLGSDCFIPDVEAHVWEDGRIYLYGSFDYQGGDDYCSDLYHVYSSDNLKDWVDHGISFSLNHTSWAQNCRALYAPDCAFRNGIYYLYYCVPDGRCGVATSSKPYGPFKDVGVIEGVLGIDPSVLIDDDGQAYLYWGQFDKVRVAKLKENMVEIEQDSIVQPLSVAEHEFHEGSSVKKINGKYYYLFTDTHRHGGKATALGYAISDNPMTGFKYAGIIIDNFGCDPESWNNHGSMECFNGQWYIFYHRSTHGSKFSRHVCAEPIFFDSDGRIAEIPQTSKGVGDTLPANLVIPANLACELSGNIRIEGDLESKHNLVLSKISNKDSATYRYLKFENEKTVCLKAKADEDCRVELYLNSVYWDCLMIPKSKNYVTVCKEVSPQKGEYELCLKFFGEFNSAFLEEFSFSK